MPSQTTRSNTHLSDTYSFALHLYTLSPSFLTSLIPLNLSLFLLTSHSLSISLSPSPSHYLSPLTLSLSLSCCLSQTHNHSLSLSFSLDYSWYQLILQKSTQDKKLTKNLRSFCKSKTKWINQSNVCLNITVYYIISCDGRVKTKLFRIFEERRKKFKKVFESFIKKCVGTNLPKKDIENN